MGCCQADLKKKWYYYYYSCTFRLKRRRQLKLGQSEKSVSEQNPAIISCSDISNGSDPNKKTDLQRLTAKPPAGSGKRDVTVTWTVFQSHCDLPGFLQDHMYSTQWSVHFPVTYALLVWQVFDKLLLNWRYKRSSDSLHSFTGQCKEI